MRGGEPRTTMGTRPGLLLLVLAFSIILPGSHQYPQNVVFRPVTYQFPTTGQIDQGISPVVSPAFRETSGISEDTSNHLICKKLQPTDGLFRVSPSTQATQLIVIPTPIVQPLSGNLFSRLFVAVPTVQSVGVSVDDIPPEMPEGAYAAPAPLMASLCVSQDNPRPFPVLFAPPVPSQLGSIDNDFRKDMFMKPSDVPFYSTLKPDMESPLRVSLNSPSMRGVTLGLQGVPATIESISPSKDDPAGKILVKLHTNPPGSITLGFTREEGSFRRPIEFETDSKLYRGQGIITHTESPAVSLVFSSPIGSIGIGSPNSPAVNIEKQNILTSDGRSSKNTLHKVSSLHNGVF